MTPFDDLMAQGAARAWFFIPSAILLGALHGLEPGHSKTMMAAFIVAIRGTVKQAVLLGVCATISHTVVVWAIALAGMWLYQGMDAEAVEPYFQLLSGVIIIGLALWMIARTRRDRRPEAVHGHHHDHHHDESRIVDTGHGKVELSIFEEGQPPHWRLRTISGHPWAARDVTVDTVRPDGTHQTFRMTDRDGTLESVDPIPEPHTFTARLTLSHGDHGHGYDLSFPEVAGLQLDTDEPMDAHARAHADDIRRRFDGRPVTNGQIAMFGITGGLLPCPAAITILLICLQLREFSLGAVMVLCFSLGLALTLVTVGVVASLGSRKARGRFPWLAKIAGRAPYLSGIVIILVGLYVGWHGVAGILG
ncbi:nickel/cobalt efflux transporter [Falsirhodobacter sp. 20TX0035]|uniref:nickel/cobalt efflux transporter n=1 Tax=Falsirhodobacter sp. 20TX0035 TaxID=3022019 RepID=UPI002330B7AB|nr:nickel/cobalt efflux transporter [Falsirhodobacter sp. 20TX0035]MDB6454070.1 nickel/cobalt efflux transporter [Falsirhodobacter sp. 20TX0035]